MKKILFMCLAAIGILVSGCVKDSCNAEGDAQCSLVVTIKSEDAQIVRAMGNEPSQTLENTVHSFIVCVFNKTTGNLERTKVFVNTLTGEIDKLYAGTKRVVILVNSGDYSFMDAITTYPQLDDEILNLDSQIPGDFSTYGLFMSGEDSNVVLVADTTTPVDINVRRVVAKVRFESLTISPDPGSSLTDFELLGVGVQKVPYWAYLLGETIPLLDDDEYIGGFSGSVSEPIPNKQGLLYQDLSTFDITQIIQPEVYFYVFPNDNSAGKATLLTIHGRYNGENAYYTFPINSSLIYGGDGTYIKRNKIYTLNVTLKDLTAYLDDPDGISGTAVLLVTAVTEDWEGTLIENTEW